MAVVRWTFEDQVLSTQYEFEINPNAGGTPSYEKNIQFENTSAPGGKTLIFEGQDRPKDMSFSGTLLTQEHYEAFVEWYEKRRQILLTDDLGRQFWIYIKKFTATRVRSVQYPWKHTYDVQATILDWS